MKMIIEISGGCITSIVSTQECSIYLVDHDNLRERSETPEYARLNFPPNRVTHEGGHIATPDGSETPEFNECLEKALEPYQECCDKCDNTGLLNTATNNAVDDEGEKACDKCNGTGFLNLEDCPICGMEHPVNFEGDCRDDANRYPKAAAL